MIKKIAAVLFLLIMAAGSAFAFSVNIDPPSVWIAAAAGSSKSGSITVENKGYEDINVKAYSEDWIFAKDRSKTFKRPGSTPLSCSNWIALSPEKFTIAPGKSQEVKYTVSAPANANGGYCSVIFFESQITPEDKVKNSNVILAGRIGSIVYFETQGRSTKNASISTIKAEKVSQSKPLLVKTVLKNEGNSIISAEGNAILLDDENNLRARVDIGKFYALPGETVPVIATWKGVLPQGEYDVIATIDYGGAAPVSAQTKLVVGGKGK